MAAVSRDVSAVLTASGGREADIRITVDCSGRDILSPEPASRGMVFLPRPRSTGINTPPGSRIYQFIPFGYEDFKAIG
jgi:hypothetical protein